MQRSPNNERPVRSMPKATHEEDDQNVEEVTEHGNTVSTQREIPIVAKPCGQGNMPPRPELADGPREIGRLKILHEVDPIDPGNAAGDVGITREVAINLQGEKVSREQQA